MAGNRSLEGRARKVDKASAQVKCDLAKSSVKIDDYQGAISHLEGALHTVKQLAGEARIGKPAE